MNIFTSPFLLENINSADKKHHGRLLKHFENAAESISYHLTKIVPKGGIVCAYHPKSILAHILPVIAKEKNCKVIPVHGTKQAMAAFLKAGIISNLPLNEADVIITEPDGLTSDGALFTSHEAAELPHRETIAVGSALQFTKNRPATHDIAPVYKIATELGIHSPEHLEKDFVSAFSWLSSSASPLSPALPQPWEPSRPVPSPFSPTLPPAP